MGTKAVLALALVAVISFAVVWIFLPTIHYFRSINVNTMTTADFTLFDKYTLKQETKRTVGLSVVVPAYNEELRLPVMLDEAFEYLNAWASKTGRTFEIIVVDDGSKDGTVGVVQKYMERHDQLRLLKLHANGGKGAALKIGVRESLGDIILIADADAATDIRDLDRLIPALESSAVPSRSGPAAALQQTIGDKLGMVVGSRAHMAKDSIAKREFYRTVLMKGFHVYVQLLVTRNVQDTQCGFKLFTRAAGRSLFGTLHLYRWAFDTEIIYLAEWLGVPIQEIAVNWHEVDGSKLIQSKMDVVSTSITMARDILCMRLSYLLWLWKYPDVSAQAARSSARPEL